MEIRIEIKETDSDVLHFSDVFVDDDLLGFISHPDEAILKEKKAEYISKQLQPYLLRILMNIEELKKRQTQCKNG